MQTLSEAAAAAWQAAQAEDVHHESTSRDRVRASAWRAVCAFLDDAGVEHQHPTIDRYDEATGTFELPDGLRLGQSFDGSVYLVDRCDLCGQTGFIPKSLADLGKHLAEEHDCKKFEAAVNPPPPTAAERFIDAFLALIDERLTP